MRDPSQLEQNEAFLKKLKLNFHENGEAIKTVFVLFYDYNETIFHVFSAMRERKFSCFLPLYPLHQQAGQQCAVLLVNCKIKFNGK
jgi:ACT domain-containing protein